MHKQMNNDTMHKPQAANLKKLSQTKPVNHKAYFPSLAMLNLLPKRWVDWDWDWDWGVILIKY